jgi:hypothetical protein
MNDWAEFPSHTNALVAAGAAAFVMCGLLLDHDPLPSL